MGKGVDVGKVFGIGWAKTGTTSLGKAFEILGFDHQGQDLRLVPDIEKGDLSRIVALAKRKQAFEDWPWILLYRELDQIFPGSRFVLTVRESDTWASSYENMLLTQGRPSSDLNSIRRTLYGLPFPFVSAEALVERYEAHNRDVMSYFSSRRDDLLVVNWENGDGWPQLCGFLGIEVPAEPFPHLNKAAYSRTPLPARR